MLLLSLVVTAARHAATQASVQHDHHRQKHAPQSSQSAALAELFDSLARNYGGPSFVDKTQIKTIEIEAYQRLADDAARQKVAPADADVTAVADWVMRSLDDPHASYMRPTRAGSLVERYHGRVALGLRLRYEQRRRVAACGAGTGGGRSTVQCGSSRRVPKRQRWQRHRWRLLGRRRRRQPRRWKERQ